MSGRAPSSRRHRAPDRGGPLRRAPDARGRSPAGRCVLRKGEGGRVRLRRHLPQRLVAQEARHDAQQEEAALALQRLPRGAVGACLQAQPSQGSRGRAAARVLGLRRLCGQQRQRLPRPLLPRAHRAALPPRCRRLHGRPPRGGPCGGAHLGELRAHHRLRHGGTSHPYPRA